MVYIPIKFSAHYYYYYNLIVSDEIIEFEEVGGFENKEYGNELLCYHIFDHLLRSNLIEELNIPNYLKSQMEEFIDHFEVPSIEKLQFYGFEDSYYFALKGLYKDIVGTWGPSNWDGHKGTHLGVKLEEGGVKIIKIGIEDQEIDVSISFNAYESFLLASNTLLQGYYWSFSSLRNSLATKWELSISENGLRDDLAQEINQVAESRKGRNVLEYLAKYISYLSFQMRNKPALLASILSTNGNLTVAILFDHEVVQNFLQSILTKQYNDHKNWPVQAFCILDILETDHTVFMKLLENIDLKKEEYNKLKLKLIL